MIAATAGSTAPPRKVEFVRLLDVVRREYREMPGLRLTRCQAQRLWALDTATCDEMLDVLESAQFLRRSGDGKYTLTQKGKQGGES